MTTSQLSTGLVTAGAVPAGRSQLGLLGELAGRLEAGSRPVATFASLAKACVPVLSDECFVELIGSDSALQRIHVTESGCEVVVCQDGPLPSTRRLMVSGAAAIESDALIAVPLTSSIAIDPYLGVVTAVRPALASADAVLLLQSLIGRAVEMTAAARLAEALSNEQSRTHNLETALDSNREIGMAMGIVMARSGCTRDDAFERLRRASQDGNRKLRDIAADVVLTGTFDDRSSPTRTVHPQRREFIAHSRRKTTSDSS